MAIPLDTNSRTEDIVDAISRLVLEGGFERVTMRAIADQVRISQGTLVNHLSNRERLRRSARSGSPTGACVSSTTRCAGSGRSA